MKKIFFIISFLTLFFACQKEVSDLQSTYFVKFYGDADDDIGSEVELAADGGYVIAGTTTRTTGDKDFILITTDKYGIQNSPTVYYGGSGDQTCNALLVLDDGYVLTGSSLVNGVEYVVLVKIGLDGNLVWVAPGDSLGSGMDLKLNNNQVVLAGFNPSGTGYKKPIICNYDLQGNIIDLWTPVATSSNIYFTSIGIRNNQVFGFGTSANDLANPVNNDLFIIGRATAPYNFSFSSGNESSAKIISGSQGGFFIVGTTDPIGSGFSQIVVKKLNDDFSEDLSFNANPIGADADFIGVDIQEMENGSIAILGQKTVSKDTDIVLYILNPDGSIQSSKIYGKTGNQSASSLKRTSDGGLIILGSNQQEKTNSMITLIKTDKDGNIWE